MSATRAVPRKSPTLKLVITEDQQQEAIQSNSGGCMVADAIQRQYPQYSRPLVDMATIRFTDKETGVRFTYLTPPAAQQCLLAFDQGYALGTQEVTVKNAVQITAPRKGDRARTDAQRAKRLADLRAKRDAGTLTPNEQGSLTRLEAPKPAKVTAPDGRPTTDSTGRVLVGGKGIARGPNHPNLLRSHDRHFGAKLADPGQIFEAAVDAEVKRRMTA